MMSSFDLFIQPEVSRRCKKCVVQTIFIVRLEQLVQSWWMSDFTLRTILTTHVHRVLLLQYFTRYFYEILLTGQWRDWKQSIDPTKNSSSVVITFNVVPECQYCPLGTFKSEK